MNYKSVAIWRVAPDISGAPLTDIDGAVNAYHVNFTMNSAPLKRRLLRHAGADGGADQGFALQPLKAVWELFVKADTEAAFEAKRDAIYRLFKPYDNAIKIQVDLASAGPFRQLDAIVDGPVDFRQSQQLGYSALVRVPLYCPSPLWYHPTQNIATATPGVSGSSFSFVYGGNYEEWPVIEIEGAITSPVLSMTTTTAYRTESAVINLTGVTIPAGTIYTIDMRPGRKTVIDSNGTINRINQMVDSTWVYFKLWPFPYKATGGTNLISYTYTSKDAAARFRVKFYNRYLSY